MRKSAFWVFGLVVLSSAMVAAQPTPTPIARYDASGDLLPPAYDANWVLNQTGSPSISVGGGQLKVGSGNTGTDSVYWQWSSPGFNVDRGWTMIVRAARGTGQGDSTNRQALIEVSEPGSPNAYEGWTEGLSIGDTGDVNKARTYRAARGDESGLNKDVVREYWYYQPPTLTSSHGDGLGYIDGVLGFPTGSGTQNIDGDYIRFGIWDAIGGQPGKNEYIIESVQVFGEAFTPTPVPTDTPVPCEGGMLNCSFESGMIGWTIVGGANPDGGGTFCGGRRIYESSWSFWDYAMWSNLNGTIYQTASPEPGVGSVTVSCWASDFSEGLCQESNGAVRVGVDPTAGTDPGAGSVQWGDWLDLSKVWQQAFSPQVTLSSPYTVFVQWSVQFGATGWAFVNIDLVEASTVLLPSPTPAAAVERNAWGRYE